jgi:hypothetical protein
MLISVFTRACHWILSWAGWLHSASWYHACSVLDVELRLSPCWVRGNIGSMDATKTYHILNAYIFETNHRKVINNIVGFEVFTAVVMKSIIFWDMTPCSLPSACSLVCWNNSSALKMEAIRSFPKRRVQLNVLHGVITQKMILLINNTSLDSL